MSLEPELPDQPEELVFNLDRAADRQRCDELFAADGRESLVFWKDDNLFGTRVRFVGREVYLSPRAYRCFATYLEARGVNPADRLVRRGDLN